MARLQEDGDSHPSVHRNICPYSYMEFSLPVSLFLSVSARAASLRPRLGTAGPARHCLSLSSSV